MPLRVVSGDQPLDDGPVEHRPHLRSRFEGFGLVGRVHRRTKNEGCTVGVRGIAAFSKTLAGRRCWRLMQVKRISRLREQARDFATARGRSVNDARMMAL